MKESYEPKVRIAEPWTPEIEINDNSKYENHYFSNDPNLFIKINLVNNGTGEIRQKIISLDTLARKVFESEIKTWNIEIEKR